jgi:glutathione S-transferase
MIRFSAITGIPEFTKGLVREIRVRWALQEMGVPYEEVRYPHAELKKENYLAKQPFGQVPYLESDGLCMFESGAILLHLALKYNKLLSSEEKERARTLTWLFAALTSLEPHFLHHFVVHNDPEASNTSKDNAKKMVRERLRILSIELGDREFFGSSFSIADIVMTSVMTTAHFKGYLSDYPNLEKYLERMQSRPAFQQAYKEHSKLYEEEI